MLGGTVDLTGAQRPLLASSEVEVNKAFPVGEAIRGLEVVSIALDEIRLAITILVPQQRQIPVFCSATMTSLLGSTSNRRGCSRPVINGVAVKPSITRGACPA
jgi:hypothetical protein